MKILYTNFHPDDGGGHTTYILSLAHLLSPRNAIHVAAPGSSKLLRMARTLPGVGITAMEFDSRHLLRELRALRRLLREQRFDIVHVNGATDHRLVMLALPRLDKMRPRVVFTKHNDKPCGSFGNAMRARLATDRVIAVCDYTRRQLQDSPYRIHPIDVVHNGVDVDAFSPRTPAEAIAARARWNIPADAFVLGSNAGTASYKGWLDLLEALPLLPEAIRARIHVLIAGKMPEAAELARVHASGLAARVHFTGPLDDVRPMIGTIDAGFVLSHGVETISFACREMMAMGKPVLVSDHAGLPENIAPGVDGWVTPARDIAAIAAQVQRIVENREALPAMGQAARAHAVAAFSRKDFLEGTLACYRRALESRGD